MIEFYISDEESLIYDLKVARAFINNDINLNQLYSLIFENEIDVCKLKLKLSDIEVFEKLYNCPIPYSVYSILVKQIIDIENYDFVSNDKLRFQKYSKLDKKLMKEIVSVILENDTAKYYKSSLNDTFLKRENTIKAIVEYQTRFDKKVNERKLSFVVYFENEPIGFCSIIIDGYKAKGDYVGILPNYRNNNFFKHFIQNAIFEAKLKKCKIFEVDTVLLNPKSLNKTLSEGMEISGGIININLFSLLSYSKEKSTTFKSSYDSLLENILENIKKEKTLNIHQFVLSKFHMNRGKPISSEVEWILKKCYHVCDEICYVVYSIKSANFCYITFIKTNLL